MHSYEEKVVGMGHFLQQTQGMAPEQAKLAAIEWLAKMPAYKNR
jgi:hypothetical protein